MSSTIESEQEILSKSTQLPDKNNLTNSLLEKYKEQLSTASLKQDTQSTRPNNIFKFEYADQIIKTLEIRD